MTRVLVVDDEPQILRALGINLRARGYDVDLAPDGEHALTLAARHHPDVVVLDLGLPGIDGVEVIRGLRGWSTVPIVVLSVRDGERDKVAALDAGADDYVTKPFGMDELLARLRAALRRAAPAEEEPVVVTADFTIDLAAKRVHARRRPRSGSRRPSGTSSRCSCATRASSCRQRQLLQEVWGPEYDDETNYLRVHMAQRAAQARARAEPTPLLLHRAGDGLPLRVERERSPRSRRWRRTALGPRWRQRAPEYQPRRASPRRRTRRASSRAGAGSRRRRGRPARAVTPDVGEHRAPRCPRATKIITLPARTAAANGPGATSGGERRRGRLRCHSRSGALARARSSSVGVDVDADGAVAAAGQLDGDPPGAAAGVEHRVRHGRRAGVDERRLHRARRRRRRRASSQRRS